MLPLASHDLIVMSDSDIRVAASYLENVISALEEPGVGMVSCLYCGVPAAGFWSRLAAEGINSHFLPNALVGLRLGFAKPCFGATIALQRELWPEIGGFEAFADQLADDYGMGMAVRRLGLGVVIPTSLSATFATTGASPILSGMSFARPAPSATSTRGAMRNSS